MHLGYVLVSLIVLVGGSSDYLDEFVSEIIRLEDLTASYSVETGRLTTAAFAGALKAHQSALNDLKTDCSSFSRLAAYFAFHHILKADASHHVNSLYIDNLMNRILVKSECSTSRVGEARTIGMNAAKAQLTTLANDEFFSFFLLEQEDATVPAELRGSLSFDFANFAYKKLVCFDADPISLFQVPPSPQLSSKEVTDDWKELYKVGCDNSSIAGTGKTEAQNATGEFWQRTQVGADGDYASSAFGIFLLLSRQLINSNVESGLFAKKLQYYILLSAAMENAASANFRFLYHFNAWPVIHLMQNGVAGSGLLFNSEWNSTGNTNNNLKMKPSYPVLDAAIASAFVAVATELFSRQSVSATVSLGRSTKPRNPQVIVNPTRLYATLKDLQQEWNEAILYAGISFRFSVKAADGFGRQVGIATRNMLISGNCQSYYPV